MKKILTFITFLCAHTIYAQQYVTNQFFGTGGVVSFVIPSGGETTDILLQPDGKIINCGYVYDGNCNCNYITMFRVDACGEIDSAFGTNGIVVYTFDQRNSGYDYLLEPNGKIVVVGTQASSNNGSDQKPFIARFLNNGQPDSTFGTFGTTKVVGYPTYSSFTYVHPLDSGKYLAMNGHVIMRFDSTGTIDSSFGANGIISHTLPSYVNFVYSFRSIQRSDKKIISVGSAYLGVGNEKSPLFICTDTLGQIDSSFGTNGFIANSNTSSGSATPFFLVLQSDEKILSGFNNSNESAIVVSRYNTNGSLDTTYGIGGYASYPGSGPFRFNHAAILSNDDLVIAANGSGTPAQLNTIDASGTVTNSVTIDGSNNFQLTNGCGTQRMHIVNDDEIILTSHCGGGYPWHIGHVTTTPNPTISQNVAQLNAGSGFTTYQWYLNGNIISGATDSIYTFTQNGLYSVTVTNTIGCNYTYSYTVTNTGIASEKDLAGVSFFPNPVTNHLTINNSNKKELTIKLFDAAGKLILEEKIISDTYNIATNNVDKGMYFLEIQSGTDISRAKIVKQ